MTCTSKLGWQGTNAIWELPVVEHRLDIGLRLLLWERRESPVVYSDLYLPVGSVNDPPGLSGMAHFVEHMLFKGTRRFPKGAIDRLTFLAGGQANAETDEDSTHFWFGLPSTHLELALVLESDRLRHSRFDPAEVESERGVIAEESRRELDQPWSRLERAHLAACFPGHPYRYPVLGLSEDLARITAADLRQFHRERYGPDGATLVVVGDFEATRLIDQVNEHFGQIPPVASGRRSREPEAPLAAGPLPGAKLELPGVDTILRGLLGWRTCPRTDADSAALEVLAELLGSGRGSRLWRKLVHRRQLATSADASHEPSLLDGVFYIGIEAERRVDHRRIVDAVLADLADLARRGPSLLELERVRQRLSAGWLWELDDLGASASGLGHASLAGDWRRWPQEYQAALRVEPGDIRRVIRTYLKPDTLIEGWLLTQSTRGQIQVPSAPESAVVAGNSTSKDPFQPGRFTGLFAGLVRVPGNPALGRLPDRHLLPNGMRLIGDSRPGCGVLALEFYCDSGILRELRPGLAFLTAKMREEGTRGRSGSAIARLVEQAGGSLEVLPAGISLRIGQAHLEMALGLLADLARRPSFPAHAFDWTRRRLKAELVADLEDPAYLAGLEFMRKIYGRHPYGRDPRGTRSGLDQLTLADVRGHQAKWMSPDRSFLVVAGDFEWPELIRVCHAAFGDWPNLGHAAVAPRQPQPRRTATHSRLPFDGNQTQVVMGHLGIERRHPAYTALVVVDHILGAGPGLTDRLNRHLRDELGLVYSVQGGMTDSADVVPGLFRVGFATQPGETDRAIAAVNRELRAVHAGAFSDHEIEEARQYLASSWVFDFQGISQRAERWLELERWGLPPSEVFSWPEELAQLTPELVRRAAREHLKPEQMVLVECGPDSR